MACISSISFCWLVTIDWDMAMAGGWRSSVAASLLRAAGFDDVSDLAGEIVAET
jgi:hypothetical protein